jgi:hypothetical protein
MANKEQCGVLLIVGIVALLAVSTFFTGSLSSDLTGHATSTIKAKSSAKITKTTSSACTDSDGGKDYSEKGTTKGILWTDQDAGVNTYTDSCKDVTSLKEYRCVADDGTTEGTAFAYFNTITCSEGYCLDGICVSGCYDTEGDDLDPSIAGTITSGGKTYTDQCCTDGVDCAGYSDSGHVKEYYCNGNSYSIVYPSCTRGTTCVDGECV